MNKYCFRIYDFVLFYSLVPDVHNACRYLSSIVTTICWIMACSVPSIFLNTLMLSTCLSRTYIIEYCIKPSDTCILSGISDRMYGCASGKRDWYASGVHTRLKYPLAPPPKSDWPDCIVCLIFACYVMIVTIVGSPLSWLILNSEKRNFLLCISWSTVKPSYLWWTWIKKTSNGPFSKQCRELIKESWLLNWWSCHRLFI